MPKGVYPRRKRHWIEALIDKLPDFDPSWPLEIQQKWYACHRELWRLVCRTTVDEAIGAHH